MVPAPETPSGQCTPGQWSPSLCTRCLSNGQWPQGGIVCPPGNLDYGDGSDVAAWCACELLCTGTNTNPACLTALPPAPTSCSARGGFCAFNGSCPTNKGYNNVGSTSDCPGGCCAFSKNKIM